MAEYSENEGALIGLLKSGTGTALVTVLLGGLLGQLISCSVQNKLKEREFNDAWLKARADQALTSRKEYLDARKRTFNEVIGLAAEMASASEDLLYVTSPQYNIKGLHGTDREHVLADQGSLVTTYRSASSKWATGRFRYDFEVSYFAEKNNRLIETWSSARDNVDELRRCANDTYIQWFLAGQGVGSFGYSPALCGKQRQAVITTMRDFGKEASATADYTWRGWDDPRALRRLLDNDSSNEPASSATATVDKNSSAPSQ